MITDNVHDLNLCISAKKTKQTNEQTKKNPDKTTATYFANGPTNVA